VETAGLESEMPLMGAATTGLPAEASRMASWAWEMGSLGEPS
jgi:hypothetical protein